MKEIPQLLWTLNKFNYPREGLFIISFASFINFYLFYQKTSISFSSIILQSLFQFSQLLQTNTLQIIPSTEVVELTPIIFLTQALSELMIFISDWLFYLRFFTLSLKFSRSLRMDRFHTLLQFPYFFFLHLLVQ